MRVAGTFGYETGDDAAGHGAGGLHQHLQVVTVGEAPKDLANIIAGTIVTLVNGFLTFIPPLIGLGRPPALPEYLFFATIETICTVAIVWQAWNWPGVDSRVPGQMQGVRNGAQQLAR